MAYHSNPWDQKKQDTGWGLIFRLNLLMGKIENDVENMNLDRWNLHIDRIYANIHYKNPYEIVYDEDGKVLDIQFDPEDVKVFTRFANRINEIKEGIHNVVKDEEGNKKNRISKLQSELYNIIFKKDLWIRKVMFKLKLYLRESESNPAKAIYGG